MTTSVPAPVVTATRRDGRTVGLVVALAQLLAVAVVARLTRPVGHTDAHRSTS